jgi:glutamine amidotransferase
MSQCDVAIIDYGLGNLYSVSRALEYWGAKVLITSNINELLKSPRVILPGVGAFSRAITELKKNKLDSVINEIAKSGTPLLGICLGMQMLMNESYEFGKTEGLKLIPGKVEEIPKVDKNGYPLKVPHIGWQEQHLFGNSKESLGIKLMKNCNNQSMYFVHSFRVIPDNQDNLISTCNYGGNLLTAVIAKENIFGCQFHPEKSGMAGLYFLRNFMTI